MKFVYLVMAYTEVSEDGSESLHTMGIFKHIEDAQNKCKESRFHCFVQKVPFNEFLTDEVLDIPWYDLNTLEEAKNA